MQTNGRPAQLEPALLTAARLLDWRRVAAGPAAGWPNDVIVTHQGSLFRALVPRFRSRSLAGLATPVRAIGHGRFGVALPALGGPATAMLVDELAALGVRRMLSVDLAGAIVPDLPPGSIIVVESASCGDGTSGHYAPGHDTVAAAPALASALTSALAGRGVACRSGRVWSTDAPYRETPVLLQRARAQGAIAIDMETSALYAAGLAAGIECVALLVTADRLLEDWQPPPDLRSVQSALRRAADAALTCLRS